MKHVFFYQTPREMTVKQLLLNEGFSKRLITAVKQNGQLSVNSSPVFVNECLHPGQILRVELPPQESALIPAPMKLDILYEDKHILIINKAAGVPVHPSQGHHGDSLSEGAAWYLQKKGEPDPCRIINRLDRDTSGLVIVARHPLSACLLSGQMFHRQIRRTYLAVVSGNLTHPFPALDHLPKDTLSGPDEHGFFRLRAPIGRVPDSIMQRQVDWNNGDEAITLFRPLFYSAAFNSTLLEVRLETGRTHQIRVHMNYLGHPLYGDFLYFPDYRYISRQSLHAWKLEFCHPVTKEALTFTAAVPDDMKCFFSNPVHPQTS